MIKVWRRTKLLKVRRPRNREGMLDGSSMDTEINIYGEQEQQKGDKKRDKINKPDIKMSEGVIKYGPLLQYEKTSG